MRPTSSLLWACALLCLTVSWAMAQDDAAPLDPSRGVSARLDSVCGRATVYGCYANHRYGYVVAWPKKFLQPGGESDSGDGQRFRSRDGSAEMACWGVFHEVIGNSLAEAYSEAAGEPGAQVTYKHLGKDFFVLSGIREGKIFYRKTIRAGDVEASFELVYSPALKDAFDPIVKDVSGGFVIDPAFAWQEGR